MILQDVTGAVSGSGGAIGSLDKRSLGTSAPVGDEGGSNNSLGVCRITSPMSSTKTVRWKLYEFTELDELQHVYKPSITCL